MLCQNPYEGRSVAASNVSLDVQQGSLVARVGGSGSGKTTLLKTINRLVDPDLEKSGSTECLRSVNRRRPEALELEHSPS
ncbi:ATP-binding cassette domain-containing protein (plasmid) [Bradyrhizobium sp. CCGUVB1N3]|uniref:ATP-binding cassette domain-containing protein n=1 Tax=Bradyrhizobium sp. CCGUVB1N3 TaxID=2949629 RepID=UPI0020B1A417|nr:ATP-binding cassette domain-containing protein [Bradyrhizobium sp. CCGUVB1N3]MCP3477969.1 ATP-binding cassette domain-containing protein [Bradyrhizobium sp. CCGUVB1N3]